MSDKSQEAGPQYELANNQSTKKERTLSRRRFLQIAGVGAGTTAVAAAGGKEAINQLQQIIANFDASPEKRVELAKHVIRHAGFVDFAPQTPTPGLEPTAYPNNKELTQRILKEDYLSPYTLLVEKLRCLALGDDFEDHMLREYPQAALTIGAMSIFSNHGRDVKQAHERILNKFSFSSPGMIMPVQEIFDTEDENAKYEDKLGNKGIEISFSAEKLIALLKKQTDLPPILNFSFQLGKVRLTAVEYANSIMYRPYSHMEFRERVYFYDRDKYSKTIKLPPNSSPILTDKETNQDVPLDQMYSVSLNEFNNYQNNQQKYHFVGSKESKLHKNSKVQVEIQGSYLGEEGTENFKQLVQVANAFPNNLFVCAAGNYGDDLRPIRETLGSDWPANIIIVGQWNSNWQSPMVGLHQIHGADIYVDNESLQMGDGSSLSTATISAMCDMMYEFGIPLQDMKRYLEFGSFSFPYYVYPVYRADEQVYEEHVTLEEKEKNQAQVMNLEGFMELLKAMAMRYEIDHPLAHKPPLPNQITPIPPK